jgi:hypothetical protein
MAAHGTEPTSVTKIWRGASGDSHIARLSRRASKGNQRLELAGNPISLFRTAVSGSPARLWLVLAYRKFLFRVDDFSRRAAQAQNGESPRRS